MIQESNIIFARVCFAVVFLVIAEAWSIQQIQQRRANDRVRIHIRPRNLFPVRRGVTWAPKVAEIHQFCIIEGNTFKSLKEKKEKIAKRKACIQANTLLLKEE
jgi:hypothetical protein